MFIKETKTSKEGVFFILNQKMKPKTGNFSVKEYFAGWDKIGSLLFENYGSEQAANERGWTKKEEKKEDEAEICGMDTDSNGITSTWCYNRFRLDPMSPEFIFCPYCGKPFNKED